MNRTVGLRSLYRDAPGLVEPVLVVHGGRVIGRYVPVAAAEAMAALPDGSSREVAKVAGVSPQTVINNRPVQSWTPDEPDAEPARVIGADGTEPEPQAVVAPTSGPVSGSLARDPRRQHERDALLERMSSRRP